MGELLFSSAETHIKAGMLIQELQPGVTSRMYSEVSCSLPQS